MLDTLCFRLEKQLIGCLVLSCSDRSLLPPCVFNRNSLNVIIWAKFFSQLCAILISIKMFCTQVEAKLQTVHINIVNTTDIKQFWCRLATWGIIGQNNGYFQSRVYGLFNWLELNDNIVLVKAQGNKALRTFESVWPQPGVVYQSGH